MHSKLVNHHLNINISDFMILIINETHNLNCFFIVVIIYENNICSKLIILLIKCFFKYLGYVFVIFLKF